MGFSRQEYWSGFPFPPSGDLPDPGIEPTSPALAGKFFTLSHLGSWCIGVTFALSLLLNTDPDGAVSVLGLFLAAQWLSIPYDQNSLYFTNIFCAITFVCLLWRILSCSFASLCSQVSFLTVVLYFLTWKVGHFLKTMVSEVFFVVLG